MEDTYFIRQTLGDFLDECAQKHPDNDALVYVERKLRYSYREFNDICRRAAKGFLKMGVKKGDKVAVWAYNYPQWIITMFATAKIGAVLVTVNTNYKIFEAEYLLKQSDTMTLLLMHHAKDCDYVDIMHRLCPTLATSEPGALECEKLPYLKNVIYIDDDETPAGMFSWEDVLRLGDSVPDEELDAIQRSLDIHDVVNMQYTSGTTGFPKGVMLTHFNVINNGFYIGEHMNFTYQDRLCIPVPFFHCFGCVLAILASVTHCATMVPIDVFSPTKVLQAIQAEKCTAVHGVPTMFIFMLEHPDFDKYDLSSLRTGIMAGSPCPKETMKAAIEKMHMSEIVISYGQTEASPVCTMTSTHDSLEHRVSSVGKAMPAVECKVVDPETGKTLGPHQTGEFCARGYNIMKGYYKLEEATRAVIDEEGWLHSGDLVTVDEDGYYNVVGRVKDMIIRGGENIYPRELEELLYTHPQVSDVQVVGVPDKQLGEEVCAYIILKEGADVDEAGIKQFVLDNMSRHKVPKHVVFVSEFPMTASGKIQKYKLRDMAVEQFGLQEDASIETA